MKPKAKKTQFDIMVSGKPKLPAKWNYDESVKKMKAFVYKWKNMTIEMLEELWIAREMTKFPHGLRKGEEFLNEKMKTEKGWYEYCAAIGISYNTAEKWLKCFEEGLVGAKGDKLALPSPDQIEVFDSDDLTPEQALKAFGDAPIFEEARDKIAQFVDLEDTPLTHWDFIQVHIEFVKKGVK